VTLSVTVATDELALISAISLAMTNLAAVVARHWRRCGRAITRKVTNYFLLIEVKTVRGGTGKPLPHFLHSTPSAERGSGPWRKVVSELSSRNQLLKTYTPWKNGQIACNCGKRTCQDAGSGLSRLAAAEWSYQVVDLQSRTRWPTSSQLKHFTAVRSTFSCFSSGHFFEVWPSSSQLLHFG